MTITQTISVHTARTLSEIENDHITSRTHSIASSGDRTTAVEDLNSIPLKCYPPSKSGHHDNDTIEENYMKSSNINNKNKGIESISKKKRRWLIFKKIMYIIIMNAAIPITLYYLLKPHLPAVWALVLSSTPTIISVIVQAIFMKKIDSIGIAVIFGKVCFYILYIM